MSGIIAADQNNAIGVSGVAPGAQVMPLRVLDAGGTGTHRRTWPRAFNYAGQHSIRIVNASLGGDVGIADAASRPSSTTPTRCTWSRPATTAPTTTTRAPRSIPCDLPAANLICVGASDQNDQPAWFSDYGAANVDLFAPGVNILSTWTGGGYAYADGTSMATPMVTGTLALMLAHNPSLTAAQLKADLLASVDPAPQLAGMSVTGGELDAAAAVATAGGRRAVRGARKPRGRPWVSGIAVVGGPR